MNGNFTEVYQGDPYLQVTVDGIGIIFKDGQPIMDQGIENTTVLRLIFKKDWFANAYLPTERRVKKSQGMVQLSKPLTVNSINNAKRGFIADLKPLKDQGLISKIEVDITNPKGNNVDVVIRLYKPNESLITLLAKRNGLNWLWQVQNPANRKI